MTNAEEVQHHLTLIINKTKERMNISVEKTIKKLEETYTIEVNQFLTEIESLIEQYNNVIISNELPEILILQTLANS